MFSESAWDVKCAVDGEFAEYVVHSAWGYLLLFLFRYYGVRWNLGGPLCLMSVNSAELLVSL